MAQLIVRRIEEDVVRKLKQLAGKHGLSVEEEHRQILREAVNGASKKTRTFKEHLMGMPNVGPDEIFDRQPDAGRDVDL